MRKQLSQEEIDALFTAAQPSKTTAPAGPTKNVQKCDLGKSKTLSAEQIRVVNTLHESFARKVTDSMGTYLRTACQLNLVAAEQLRYSEFLGRVPESSYLVSIRTLPIDAGALLLMDMALIFPIIDLALGGSGTDAVAMRNTTEIEDQIVETAMSLIARDLQNAWAPVVAFDIQFDQRQPVAQAHALMLPNERTLSLNFEIRILDLRGAFNIVLPSVVANALLRKLASPTSLTERIPSRNTRRKMRESILDGYFVADLSLPPSAVSVRELMNLEPEYVLALPNRADKPAHLNIAGRPVFEAHPVRRGAHKGARIERRTMLNPSATRE